MDSAYSRRGGGVPQDGCRIYEPVVHAMSICVGILQPSIPRESFEEMIEDMGFDRPDGQTAYILRARADVSAREMKSEIVNWSECVGSYIDVEDRVDSKNSTFYFLKIVKLYYDSNSRCAKSKGYCVCSR